MTWNSSQHKLEDNKGQVMIEKCICGKEFINKNQIYKICDECIEDFEEYIIKNHENRKSLQPERLNEEADKSEAIV